jgi:hypothetical protein
VKCEKCAALWGFIKYFCSGSMDNGSGYRMLLGKSEGRRPIGRTQMYMGGYY